VHGVYWLPALDAEPGLADLDLAGWRAALRVRVKRLARAMRLLYAHFGEPGAFLVSGTRLGGCHGYDDAGAIAPMGGAVSGFTKAFGRERESALVKVVDVEASAAPAEVAQRLLDETRLDPGVVEVGYQGGLRWTVGLVERPANDGRPGLSLGKHTVFVVTGAAGSIVAAIVSDLAAASGGVFHLLDLAPEPREGHPDLARFEAGDRDGLKRDLFERLKARGERTTPAMVERELVGLEREATALAAIRAVRTAGGAARYHRVDLKDGAAVALVMEGIRAEHGRVDVLLHAAGLEISRFLPDKEQREFDLVFDVKADGWFNLLRGLDEAPLGAAVVFSSIAGRFGNGGQTDYSSANDLCCKQISALRRTRPAARGIAIDWTAWAGIGMASRGSIPKMMELAGIDMLPAEQGIPVIRRELTQGGTRGEIVVAGRLGVLTRERDPEGGVDPAALTAAPHGPMIGRALGMSLYGGLAVETTLQPKSQGFLDHHRIDGTPVLPGVMGIEGFAEAALLTVPGWHVAAVEDVSFAAPFKLYRDEPRSLTLHALPVREGDAIVVHCSLTGERSLPGRAEPQTTVHFTGQVRLAREAPALGTAALPEEVAGTTTGTEAIYRAYFHGPAYRVLSSVWSAGELAVGRWAEGLPPNHAPSSAPTVLAPRLIELVFQTAGLRDVLAEGRMALPRHVAKVAVLGPAEDGPLCAVVHPATGGGYDAEVIDAHGAVRARVSGYGTIAMPDEGAR
jgi:NAD(P)-dependent dehydrogenase (short-subunit alcohol dehydrogenase family)